MSLCIKNVQKRENQKFGFFDKLPYLYGKPFVVQKISEKQKMQGGRSFVAPLSAARGEENI